MDQFAKFNHANISNFTVYIYIILKKINSGSFGISYIFQLYWGPLTFTNKKNSLQMGLQYSWHDIIIISVPFLLSQSCIHHPLRAGTDRLATAQTQAAKYSRFECALSAIHFYICCMDVSLHHPFPFPCSIPECWYTVYLTCVQERWKVDTNTRYVQPWSK